VKIHEQQIQKYPTIIFFLVHQLVGEINCDRIRNAFGTNTKTENGSFHRTGEIVIFGAIFVQRLLSFSIRIAISCGKILQ
jgi:hypothetical protein